MTFLTTTFPSETEVVPLALSEGISCANCPLRPLPLFFDHTAKELELLMSLKQRSLHLEANETLIHEGQGEAPLYTLRQGWAFRYKTLSDGRRQILGFLLAGDIIGVQQKIGDTGAHGVDTITAVSLCVFSRHVLWEIHQRSPSMGLNLTWLTAAEGSRVDDMLLSVGRRNAEERVASCLVVLFRRAAALQNDNGKGGIIWPLTQQHIADSLGMSLVHTNKTLRKLQARGFFEIKDGRLFLEDVRALAKVANLHGDGQPAPRPLI